MSGSVGIPIELGNQCFLGFLKEITLIAASPKSLQGADAIGYPQGLSLALWGSSRLKPLCCCKMEPSVHCLMAWLWAANGAEQSPELMAWLGHVPLTTAIRLWLWAPLHLLLLLLIIIYYYYYEPVLIFGLSQVPTPTSARRRSVRCHSRMNRMAPLDSPKQWSHVNQLNVNQLSAPLGCKGAPERDALPWNKAGSRTACGRDALRWASFIH